MSRDRFVELMRKANAPVFALVLAAGLYFLSVPYWAIIGGVMLLVVGHEFGHWAAARLLGFPVPVFSVGIGAWPRWSVKLGQTEFRVTPWLLGGFVKIDPNSADFRKAAIWKRAVVLSAGVFMNMVIAVALLFAVYTIKGEPVSTGITVKEVVSVESPAAQAGIKSGDHIVSVNGERLKNSNGLSAMLRHSKADTVAVVVHRGDQTLTLTVHPDAARRIGVFIADDGFTYQRLGIGAAAYASTAEVYSITDLILTNLAAMVHSPKSSGQALGGANDLHGPIAIVQMAVTAYNGGAFTFVWFLAAISVNLAVMNLLPIPLFDGGHLLFLAVEKVRGKPLGERAQVAVAFIGLYLVLMLFVFGIYNDIAHPIGR